MASLTPVEESQLRDSLRRRLVQLDSQPTTNRRGTNHLLVDLALVGQGWSSMAMDRRAPVQALVFQCFTQHLRTALVPTRLNPVLAFLSYHQDPTGTRPWWPPLAQWIPQQLASSATKPATIRSLLRFLLSCRADWLATPSHTSVRLPETTELRSWVLNYCQECVGLGATTDPTWGHDLEAVALCRKILAHAHLPVILPDAASLSGDMGARLDACRSQLARAMDGQISAELVGLWLAKQLDTVPTKEHKDLLMTVMHLYLWQFPGQLARCQTFLRLALPSDSVIPELDWKARLGSLLFQVLTPTDIAIVERQLVGYIVRVWEHPDDLVPLPDLRPLWQSKRAYWKSNVIPLWSSGIESLPQIGALLLHWLQLAAPRQVLPILVAIGWLMQGMASQPASATTLGASETLQILYMTLVCFARDLGNRSRSLLELDCNAYWMQLTLALLTSCPPFSVDWSFGTPVGESSTCLSPPSAPDAQALKTCPIYFVRWSQMLRDLVAAALRNPRPVAWTAAAISAASFITCESHPLVGVAAIPVAPLAIWHQHLALWALSLPVQVLALYRTALCQWLRLTCEELGSLPPTVTPGKSTPTGVHSSVGERWWALCILWTRLEPLEASGCTLVYG